MDPAVLQIDPATAQEPLALLTSQGFGPLLKAGALGLVGVPIVYMLSRLARRVVARHFSAQRGLIAGKIVFYPGLLIVAVSIMTELGFSLAPLLGAAGILGVALGFASQTSVSNVISGFFLMGEQPFVVDDLIQVGDTVGQVLSIDTLSVKLRTFDNKFVRIPNESLIKSQVTNLTRFPIRRLDVHVGIAYGEDLERAKAVLLECADLNPVALMEPIPRVFFDGFGDSAIQLRLAVWATREDFAEFRYAIQADVKRRLDEAGIEIPFPHRTLYAGSKTEPIPLQLVGSAHEPHVGGALDSQAGGAPETQVGGGPE